MASGRVCDGYGVWGGGGNTYGDREPPLESAPRALACWPSVRHSTLGGSAQEERYFDWFRCRTAKKIPGAFPLEFWKTLLFQATWNEPAVLNAILTLSSVHKSDVPGRSGQDVSNKVPDEQEQFMLQHYTKAIHHLRRLFSSNDKASIRVALITCIVFVSLEFLRGRFQTAQTHLDGGLKVLRESQPQQVMDDSNSALVSSYDLVDTWILEAFSRLQTQVELFRRTFQHPYLFLQPPRYTVSKQFFHSMEAAWQSLEQLLNGILYLTEKSRQHRASGGVTAPFTALVDEQQLIKNHLIQWLATYEASKKDLTKKEYASQICILLESFHTMAFIMAGTCLSFDDETIFDSFTDHFVFLLNRSINLFHIGTSHSQISSKLAIDMSRSMADVGWIPPLYYMAIKCRIHRIRLQSIRLLESASHREGIWDSRIATRVARRVMEIEERDASSDLNISDEFLLGSFPSKQDLLQPTICQECRVNDLRVVLTDNPTDHVLILYRLTGSNMDLTSMEVSLVDDD